MTADALGWDQALDDYEQALLTLRELASTDGPADFDFTFDSLTDPIPETLGERAQELLALSETIATELAEAMAELEREQESLGRSTIPSASGPSMFVDAHA